MYGLILIMFVAYMIALVLSGIKEQTRIKSISLKGVFQLETLLIILPLFVSAGFTVEHWGTFNNPHNGGLILVFIILPISLLVALAEIIIFTLQRDFLSALKAISITLSVLFYVWFITVYGSYRG